MKLGLVSGIDDLHQAHEYSIRRIHCPIAATVLGRRSQNRAYSLKIGGGREGYV